MLHKNLVSFFFFSLLFYFNPSFSALQDQEQATAPTLTTTVFSGSIERFSDHNLMTMAKVFAQEFRTQSLAEIKRLWENLKSANLTELSKSILKKIPHYLTAVEEIKVNALPANVWEVKTQKLAFSLAGSQEILSSDNLSEVLNQFYEKLQREEKQDPLLATDFSGSKNATDFKMALLLLAAEEKGSNFSDCLEEVYPALFQKVTLPKNLSFLKTRNLPFCDSTNLLISHNGYAFGGVISTANPWATDCSGFISHLLEETLSGRVATVDLWWLYLSLAQSSAICPKVQEFTEIATSSQDFIDWKQKTGSKLKDIFEVVSTDNIQLGDIYVHRSVNLLEESVGKKLLGTGGHTVIVSEILTDSIIGIGANRGLPSNLGDFDVKNETHMIDGYGIQKFSNASSENKIVFFLRPMSKISIRDY